MDKLKKFFSIIKQIIIKFVNLIFNNLKKIWAIIIWGLCGYYLYLNYPVIKEKQNLVDYIIILLFVLLSLLPLVSEIEIFGVSLKKELINMRQEHNEEIINIKNEILNIRMYNNQVQNTHVYNNILSGDEKIREVTSKLKNEDMFSGLDNDLDLKINNDNVDLFKVRFLIEQNINKIMDLLGLGNYNRKMYESINIISSNYIVMDILNKDELILLSSNYFSDLITICNRAVHGEIISDKYYDFVMTSWKKYKIIFNKIISFLENKKPLI